MRKLLPILMLFLFLSQAAAAENVLSVRGAVCQGGVLFLTLKEEPNMQASAELNGIKTAFLENKAGYLIATLPVMLTQIPGACELKVTITKNGENSYYIRKFTAEKKNYGVQYLRLPETTLSKYDDPQSDRDNDDIKASFQNDRYIPWQHSFILPVQGRFSTAFGLRRYYNDDKEPAFHKGIDIEASLGTPIKATQNGYVKFAKRNLMLHGDTVVLEHGMGICSIYLHMNSINVKVGDFVKQGDIIGTVGAKGAATSAHLHWAVYSQSEPIDPMLLVNHIPTIWLEK